MKKILLCAISVMILSLSACTTEDNNEPPIETMAWKELECYADEKNSLRNSNLLNGGYLTYDEVGNIYFVDGNNGGIYVSEQDGKNKRQISAQSAKALQLENDWLYCTVEEGLKRIHILTGEEQFIYDGKHGEAILAKEKIYLDSPEGFISMDLDGNNKAILRNAPPSLASYTAGGDFWLGTAYDGENVKYYVEGHLYAYDEENDKVMYIEDGCWYPLLAGNWLSTFGSKTGTRYVWNLTTDEIVDLNIYAQKAVSDGKELYYVRVGNGFVGLYCWDGSEAEEIWRMEGANVCDEIYLTPENVYILPKVAYEGLVTTQLWYYNRTTGKTGQIY